MARTKTKPTAVDPPAAPPWAPDVGDRVCVAVWRPTPNPRPGEAPGAWSALWGRVVAVRRDGSQLSYETDSAAPAEADTPLGSKLRFTRPELCFDDQAAADTACRALPVPQ